MVDKAKCLADLDRFEKEATKLAFEHTAWRNKKDDPEFKVQKSESPHWDGKVYRVEAIIPFSPETIFDSCHPEFAKTWDPHVEEMEILEELSDNSILVYASMKPAFEGILKGRDGVVGMRLIDKGDVKIMIDGSIDVPQHGPKEGKIRAVQYPSGTFIHKTDDPNKSKVVTIIQSDIKGNVPAPLLSKAFYHMIDDHHKESLKAMAKGVPCAKGKAGRK